MDSEALLVVTSIAVLNLVGDRLLAKYLATSFVVPAEPLGTEITRIAAQAELSARRLRYLQVLSTERSVSLGGRAGNLGGKLTRQLSEQPLSLPDLTAEYRELLQRIAKTWKRRGCTPAVIVGIDEVDRITDADGVERFLNGIKPMFDVPGCAYLVTVSEEALDRYETRFVEVKDAFDSSFDEIVRLTPFDLEETSRLLQQRVAGFPRPLVDVCYVLAGGIPREVVRTARSLVRLRNESGRSDLADLISLLIGEKVAAIKMGYSARLLDSAPRNRLQDLLTPTTDHSWPNIDPRALIEASEVFSDLPEECPTGRRLAAAFAFYGTVLAAFDHRHVSGSANRNVDMLRSLAEIQNRLNNPGVALPLLVSTQRAYGIDVPIDTSPCHVATGWL